MREIKFRAWDNRFKTMSFGSGDLLLRISEPDYTEPMQYTGLKDAKGVEIYEGDIVAGEVRQVQLLIGDTDESCNVKMGGVVFFDYSGFRLDCMKTQYLCGERYGMCNYFDFSCDNEGSFEEMQVIGNIYQNPKLLK